MIDEAQHMHHVTSGRRLLDQLEVLKSMSNDGETVIMLTGTYDLLNMVELNGQLLRRTMVFNFPRYKFDDIQYGEFLVALKAFQTRIQTAKPTDLVTHAEYLYKSCLGLVGILKNHLERALRHSLDHGAASVELADLEATALSETALFQILSEAKNGEKFFESMHADKSLGAALGMEPLESVASVKGPSRKRVGLRKEINDPVGIEMN
jgi:hypothetical protein